MTYELTPEAMRAARAILKWSMRDLRDASGVSLATINAIENGQRRRAAHDATATKIVDAFTSAGVELLPPPADGARRIADEA